MKFIKIKHFWVTDFGGGDISFGVHICWDWRIDIHILRWMFSVGKVPIYEDRKGVKFAASNSYHNGVSKRIRSGVP